MHQNLFPLRYKSSKAGRYFEQAVIYAQNDALARRAEALALEWELSMRGVSVNPITGQVSISRGADDIRH